MENAAQIIEIAKSKLPNLSTYPYDRIRVPISNTGAEIEPIPLELEIELNRNYIVEFQHVIKDGVIQDEWEFVNIY